MIKLRGDEKILLLLHRHWIVIVQKIMISLLLLLIPLILIPFEGVFINFISTELFKSLFFFFMMIYWLLILGFLFSSWIEYWLDIWVVTTERVIDIEQVTLFHREISEFSLSRVQDVTVVIPSMLATFLHFGNIIIQTAGEKSFSIDQIPRVDEAKKLILEYSEKHRRSNA